MSTHLEATDQITTLVPVPVPGTDNRIMAVEKDGEVWVSPNHISMALRLDWRTQQRKLAAKSWACMVKMPMQVAGQIRELLMVDRKTLTMWLATIDAHRIKDAYARSILEAYQAEAAEALDTYFHGAGNDTPELSGPELMARAVLEADQTIKAQAAELEALTVENAAIKGGDGIRIKDFIKTYFVAPNERAFFEWLYFRGLLIDGRLYDEDGRSLRNSSGPKLRWDHRHPTYRGRKYFKLVPTGTDKWGGKHSKVIPERALDLVVLLANAEDLPTQMTRAGREALDAYQRPGQLRIIAGGGVA